jgi:hypothetical protein
VNAIKAHNTSRKIKENLSVKGFMWYQKSGTRMLFCPELGTTIIENRHLVAKRHSREVVRVSKETGPAAQQRDAVQVFAW